MMKTSRSLQDCCFASICFAKSSHSLNLIFYSSRNFQNIKMHHRKCIAEKFSSWMLVLKLLKQNHNNSCWNACTIQFFSIRQSISVPHINPSVFLLCSKLHKTHSVLEVNKPTNPAGCRTKTDELGERKDMESFFLLSYAFFAWIEKFRNSS